MAAGLAAYAGWNPRRPADGLPGVLYDLIGSRLSTGNAPGRAELLAAARELVTRRFPLEEDIELVVRQVLADATGR